MAGTADGGFRIDWEWIAQQEGGLWLVGYVPLAGGGQYVGSREIPDIRRYLRFAHGTINPRVGDPASFAAAGQSGITIADGIDLGHQSKADSALQLASGPDAWKKLQPRLGSRGSAALASLAEEPLLLEDVEVARRISAAVRAREAALLAREFDARSRLAGGGLEFRELPAAIQTALASLAWNTGIAAVSRWSWRVWQHALRADWMAAAEELATGRWTGGEGIRRRRRAEASLIRDGLPHLNRLRIAARVETRPLRSVDAGTARVALVRGARTARMPLRQRFADTAVTRQWMRRLARDPATMRHVRGLIAAESLCAASSLRTMANDEVLPVLVPLLRRGRLAALPLPLRAMERVRLDKEAVAVAQPAPSKAKPARPAPPPAPSDQVEALQEAAKAGTPFCAECEKAKQELAKRQSAAKTSCRAVVATVTCSHDGRKAGVTSGRWLLEVVPANLGLGDELTLDGGFRGGCGQHPSWTIEGSETGEERGTTATLRARAPAFGGALMRAHLAEPRRSLVTFRGCQASLGPIEVLAYPPGETSASLDLGALRELLRRALGYLPLQESDKAAWETNWFKGKVEYSAEWEEQSSHLAACKVSVGVGFDPLFGGKIEDVPLWTPVPPPLKRWVQAGLYCSFEAKVTAKGSGGAKYFPRTRWSESFGEIEVAGTIEGLLSINMFLVSEDLIKARAGGKTGVTVGATLEFASRIELTVEGEFLGITAVVTLEAAFGLIEISKSVPICLARTWKADPWVIAG